MEKKLSQEKLHQSMSSALDFVESKILEENELSIIDGQEMTNRITHPFEMVIDHKTITVNDLQRLSKIPTEIFFSFLPDGRMILNTGRKGRVDYDYGTKINSLTEEIDDFTNKTPHPNRDLLTEDEKKLLEENLHFWFSNKDLQKRIKQNDKYTLHQHPSNSLYPSIDDLFASATSNTKFEIIVTQKGIIKFKAQKKDLPKIIDFMNNPLNYQLGMLIETRLISFVESNGFIVSTYKYDELNCENLISEIQNI